eukprot:3120636-Karenia_brevis.AAC.1
MVMMMMMMVMMMMVMRVMMMMMMMRKTNRIFMVMYTEGYVLSLGLSSTSTDASSSLRISMNHACMTGVAQRHRCPSHRTRNSHFSSPSSFSAMTDIITIIISIIYAITISMLMNIT